MIIKENKMAKSVVFDLDGTILDTITTITYYVNKTLELEGLPHITEDECKYYAGNGAYKLIERTLHSKGITDEREVLRVLAIYKQFYDAEPLYLTSAFPFMKQTLLKLKADGYLLGVASNKPDSAAAPAVRHFFGDIFDAVSGALDGVACKPDPALVNIVLGRLGSSPEECIYVGDTSVDMETGINLGAKKKIGCLWGFRTKEELISSGADAVVSTMDELYLEITK